MTQRMRSARRIIRALADRQQGVVTRAQLLRRGLTAQQVNDRLRNGELQVVHRGVYRVGPPSLLSGFCAAAHACGAVLSHHSAAELWSLLRPRPGDIDVTARLRRRARAGIRIHCRSLGGRECTSREGIPVTTVARTLLDLFATESDELAEEALAEALSRRLVSEAAVRGLCRAHEHERGAGHLLAALGTRSGRIRSKAEGRFLELVERARLPKPAVNALVEGLEVDFLWRDEGLVVEVDGLRFHRTRAAQRNDCDRDATLLAAGYRVLRVSWEQIEREPIALAVTVGRTLAA